MKKFISDIWKFKVLWLIALTIIFFALEPHTGKKGVVLLFAAGSVIYTLTMSIYYLLIQKAGVPPEKKQSAVLFNPILLSTLLLLAVILCVSKVYGLHGVVLWEALAAGLAVDALLLVLAAKKMAGTDDLAVPLAQNMQGAAYLHSSVLISIILSIYHFTPELSGTYAAIYLAGAGLICGIIFSLFLNTQTRQNFAAIICIIFIAAFLFLGFIIINGTIKNINYFYCLAAGSISSLIILMLYSSRGNKLSNSILSLLILMGNLWISFKFARGYGLSLCATGFLSCLYVLGPFAFINTGAEDKDFKFNSKIITAGGLFLVLILLLRLFIQISGMYQEIVGLGSGYFVVGIVLGLFLPFLVEADTLLNPYKSENTKECCIVKTGLNYFAVLLLALFSIALINIFLEIEPLCAAFMGIALASAVSFIYMLKNEKQDSIWNASLGSLWIFMPLSACMLFPYKDFIAELSRLQKIEIVSVLLLVILGVYLYTQKAEACPRERGEQKIIR